MSRMLGTIDSKKESINPKKGLKAQEKELIRQTDTALFYMNKKLNAETFETPYIRCAWILIVLCLGNAVFTGGVVGDGLYNNRYDIVTKGLGSVAVFMLLGGARMLYDFHIIEGNRRHLAEQRERLIRNLEQKEQQHVVMAAQNIGINVEAYHLLTTTIELFEKKRSQILLRKRSGKYTELVEQNILRQ